MSGAGSDGQGGAGRREVAYRVFAAEFEDADLSYSESDEERAPNYVVTPTGARVNRLFLVGVLTEVEQAGEDILRARVVDPTGAFVVYAGQYQPEAQAFFDRADPPAFVAVTGKARTFQPEDSDVTYTSVRPENVNEVTAETRDRWSVGTARRTLARVATTARALDREERGDELRRLLEEQGVDVGLAAGVALAIDHYGTSGAYLEAVRDLSIQVAEVVAGEREEVDPFSTSPDASGPADLAALATVDAPGGAGGDPTDDVASVATAESNGAGSTATTGGSGGSTERSSASAGGSASPSTDSEPAESTSTGSGTGTSSASGSTGETATTTASTTAAESGSDTTATTDPGTETDETGGDTGGGGPEAEGSTGTEGQPEAERSTGTDQEVGDFQAGEFDLDEEEREAIEEEYGTSFQSGTEVDDPGEAGIDTPEPDADESTEDGGPAAETASIGGDEAAVSDPEDGAAGTDEAAARSGNGTDAESTDEAGDEPTADADAEGAGDEPTADADAEAAGDEPTADADAEAAGDGSTESDAAAAEDVDLGEAVMDAMRDNDEGEGAPEEAIVAAVTDRLGVDEDEVSEALEEALMGGRCYEPEDGVYKPI